MDVEFSYKEFGYSFFGRVFGPVAKVSFKSTKDDNVWLTIWMIVDTGADFSILPRGFSEDLGISLERDCVKDSTIGIGGTETVYLCKKKLKVKVGTLEREVPIAFLDGNEVPALLGRLGFLETFDTQFLKSHKVIFKGQ